MSMIEMFKWDELRTATSLIRLPASLEKAQNSSRLPRALKVFQYSDDYEELHSAYWNIDNNAILQGALYQSSYPVVCCLLEIFDAKKLGENKCAARPFILELLEQFCAGFPAPSEVELGNSDLSKNIIAEILKFTPQFLQILENGDDSEKVLCVDILGACSSKDPALRLKVRQAFIQLKDSFKNPVSNELLENWLDSLNK